MTLKQLWNKWNQFWFAKQSPVPAALVRILFGLLYLQFALFLAPEIDSLFGPKAMISTDLAHRLDYCPRFSVLDLAPDSSAAAYALLGLISIAALSLTLGLFTRTSALLVYLGLTSFSARNSLVFGAPDMVLTTVAFLLIFSQAGQALSLDRLIKLWTAKVPPIGPALPSPAWGLRLIQVFFAFVYWAAFSRKLLGKAWHDGTAVYYVIHYTGVQRFAPAFIFDNLWFCKLLSWGTLVIEFCLFTLIWVKEFRLAIILFAMIFHVIMDLTMILPQFQFAMIAGLVGFIEPSTLSKGRASLTNIIHKLIPMRLSFRYNSYDDYSMRKAETVRRLDFFKLVTLVDTSNAA